jgi:serine/threonine-protein kinase HipA
VQAKLSMTLVNRARDRSDTRLTVVGALDGNFIFKPPMDPYPEMPQNEHLTMKMAEAFDIRVVPSSLIRLYSGELSYILRRVDRGEDGTKIHMIDMFQVLEAFDKYKSSMEKIGKALSNYLSNTLLDKLLLFEITIFCFLTGNSDMHLKNFSMIESASGWILSPAYDLLNVAILNPEDKEELALTLEGRKNKLSREYFTRFGKGLGLTDAQINGVFERFGKKEPEALSWISRSFLSDIQFDREMFRSLNLSYN